MRSLVYRNGIFILQHTQTQFFMNERAAASIVCDMYCIESSQVHFTVRVLMDEGNPGPTVVKYALEKEVCTSVCPAG